MVDKDLESKIINTIVKPNGHMYAGRTDESYLKNHGFYDYVMQRYDDNITPGVREPLLKILKGLDEQPRCRVCGKPMPIDKYQFRFRTFCSRACSNHDPEILEKNRRGASIGLKRAYEERGDEIKAKRSKTLSEIYGVTDASITSPFSIKSVRDKSVESVMNHFGVDTVMRLKEFRGDAKTRNREMSVQKWKERGFDIEYDGDDITLFNGCPIHGDVKMPARVFNNRMKKTETGWTFMCPECYPYGEGTLGEQFIRKVLKKHNIKFKHNVRKEIYPYELDVYVPDSSVAIEYNGLYFHRSELRGETYHIDKRKRCEMHGIKLFQIWEDDFINRKDAVESEIERVLGVPENIVQAGDMEVRSFTMDEIKDFVFDNSFNSAKEYMCFIGLVSGNDIMYVAGYRVECEVAVIEWTSMRNYYLIEGALEKIVKSLDYKVVKYIHNLDNILECDVESIGFEKGDLLPADKFVYDTCRTMAMKIKEDEAPEEYAVFGESNPCRIIHVCNSGYQVYIKRNG